VGRALLGEGVLGLEVRDDLGILLRPQPLVVVAHLVAVMTAKRRTGGGDGADSGVEDVSRVTAPR
jgi:hypothetical protein